MLAPDVKIQARRFEIAGNRANFERELASGVFILGAAYFVPDRSNLMPAPSKFVPRQKRKLRAPSFSPALSPAGSHNRGPRARFKVKSDGICDKK